MKVFPDVHRRFSSVDMTTPILLVHCGLCNRGHNLSNAPDVVGVVPLVFRVPSLTWYRSPCHHAKKTNRRGITLGGWAVT